MMNKTIKIRETFNISQNKCICMIIKLLVLVSIFTTSKLTPEGIHNKLITIHNKCLYTYRFHDRKCGVCNFYINIGLSLDKISL